MKISFLFTNVPDLTQVSRGEHYTSSFEVPDAAKSLPDIQTRVIAIGELVGSLTHAYVHVSCLDISLKNYSINVIDDPHVYPRGFHHATSTTCLYFEGTVHFANGNNVAKKRTFAIHSPLTPQFPPLKGRFARKYYLPKHYTQDPIFGPYAKPIQILSEQLLILLNTETPSGNWRFHGFLPSLAQKSLVKRYKEGIRKEREERSKRACEEEKRQTREAKQAEKLAANPPQELTHGAGRVVGARPGIYKGIQMRSQLEIRFAAELDERGIQWIYEGEALGAESYLVDFYLPDLGVWVEVKGRFEARDRQVLPEIAKYLKTERKHRLLVYTGSGKCHVVNPSGFREVERKNFWGELLR